MIAIVIALLSGGGLGLLARGLFGGGATPLPSPTARAPGQLIDVTPPPCLKPRPNLGASAECDAAGDLVADRGGFAISTP